MCARSSTACVRTGHPIPGVVVNVGDYGVFADIGYEQNVILAIPRRRPR